ncbi:MAG: hypothetical protein WBO19_00290, partial [Terriglobia bacterium]
QCSATVPVACAGRMPALREGALSSHFLDTTLAFLTRTQSSVLAKCASRLELRASSSALCPILPEIDSSPPLYLFLKVLGRYETERKARKYRAGTAQKAVVRQEIVVPSTSSDRSDWPTGGRGGTPMVVSHSPVYS